MPIATNNQSYLDPAANQGRNNVAMAMMNIASPPPQPQIPQVPLAQQLGQRQPAIPSMSAPSPGAPLPQTTQPSMPIMAGVPPQQPMQQPTQQPIGLQPQQPQGY